MAQGQQANFLQYIDLLISQLQESERSLLPKELIINTVIADNNNPKESQLFNLLIEKLTKKGVDDLQQRLFKVKKTYKLNSLIEQIYKNKPKQEEQTILTLLTKEEDYFSGKFFQLNDPTGNESIYAEIIKCKRYNEENKLFLEFTLENGSYIFLNYKSDKILEVYTSYKRKVKLLELMKHLKSQNSCSAKIEFSQQKEEFMDSKVSFELGTYNLIYEGYEECAWNETGKFKAEYLLEKYNSARFYKFDIRFKQDGSTIQKIKFHNQQTEKSEINILELNYVICNYFEEKSLLKSITPNNVVENIQIVDMKMDENKEKLKKLEEISICKDNLLKFLKQQENQSLLDSLLNNLAFNNCEFISEKVNLSVVMENMNKIKQLNEELNIEESQQSILKNVVLEAIYTKLIQKSKTLQVLKVMDLLKESFHHIKSVNQMDLIIFLGGTGAGKSTSINFYLSHELEEYERYGRKFLRLKQEKDFTSDQFAKIGHSVAVSETTFIQGYKVDDMNQLMLCDCPGFDDTRGDIYDLTTMLSIDQTIKNCNSIKAIVLTLSYETFFVNRSRAVVQLFENLQQLIPGIFHENYVKNSIYLLITKANNPNAIVENLTMLIQDVYKTDNQILNQLEENKDKQHNFEKVKVQERLKIWKFVLYLIQSKKVISYDINNQMEAEEQLKAFIVTPRIEKNQFCKAMDRQDIQIAFSKYILFQIDTWQRQIFEKYLKDIPKEIEEAEVWINQKYASIKEKEKENKQKEQLIQDTKTKIIKIQNQIQTLEGLIKENNQEKILEELKKKENLSNNIITDAENAIENLRSEQKKKNSMLEKNKIDINFYINEISNIEETISQLTDNIKMLSEGNTNQLLYEYRQYDKNDEMELISSDNMMEQLQNAFNQVSDFQAQGEHSKVLAGQYSGNLVHLVYIEQDFYLVPKDAKNLQDMCQKDFIQSDGKKYRAIIEGERWQFDLGVKAQPDRKKMVYSILTKWNSGSTIPWFKISHDLPNMDLNEATIINKLAQIDAKKKTKERKGEDIKELEKEIKSLQSQIEFKGKEIIQHQKKIQEANKQQELEHTRDQIISLKQFIVDSQSEIEQAEKYIQLNVDGINSEQDHINKKKIELLNLNKQTLHYAILIKCKIEIAHLLREFAKISVDGLGIDKKIIDNNLIPSLEAYSNYYEANIENIKMLCEETFSNLKKNYQQKQS